MGVRIVDNGHTLFYPWTLKWFSAAWTIYQAVELFGTKAPLAEYL